MSKYKPRYPKENVEYTFSFANHRRHTLRFLRENENGYLIFYNKTTKCETKPMTLRRFDYMLDHNLVYSNVNVEPVKLAIKLTRQDKMNFRVLKTLSEEEKALINSKLAYTVDELELRYRKACELNEKDKLSAYRLICDGIINMLKTAN